MELIVLGSGGAVPVKERNLPSIAIKYRSEIIIFDCGEDLQRRFQQAGLKFNIPISIFISHMHGDHIIGLPGLLFNFALKDRIAPIKIFGPLNTFSYLLVHRMILGLSAPYDIEINDIDLKNSKMYRYRKLNPEEKPEELEIKDKILVENKKYAIKSILVEHSIPTFAFSFNEKPRYGKFYPDKAMELKIPRGYLWKKLHKGEEIEYNGRVINPEKEGIVGAKRAGRKVTYSGDTGPCEDLVEFGKDSNVLIHDATFANQHEAIAREKKHSTAKDAALIAKKMNAQQLILFHISQRYKNAAEILVDEAKEIFDNSVLAYDLLSFELK